MSDRGQVNGVPGERWLTNLMNRINPALFSAAFADWGRENWPNKAGLLAIDGKTSRRSRDRSAGVSPLHRVSAFASTARLVLAQEAVPEKPSELAAIPVQLERLGADDGLRGALVTIDAIATNAAIAEAITAEGADDLDEAIARLKPTLAREELSEGLKAPIERLVELALITDGLDDPADLTVGAGDIGGEGLASDARSLHVVGQLIPQLQDVRIRPRRQFGRRRARSPSASASSRWSTTPPAAHRPPLLRGGGAGPGHATPHRAATRDCHALAMSPILSSRPLP